MGMSFRIAGEVTPAALARHAAAGFLAERAPRLGVSLLVCGFVLGPLTYALAQTARGEPLLDTAVAARKGEAMGIGGTLGG